MSIYSDFSCGAMSEVEFHNACARMNREDRYYEAMEAASMYYTKDDFDGCPYGYSKIDEGGGCLCCNYYEICQEDC